MGDDSPNTPLALILIAGAALFSFMALRPWPQSGGKSVLPEAYAQSIISGDPLAAGPAPANETAGIETGLKGILIIWALSKLAGLFTNFPSVFGSGSSEEGGGDNATGGGEEENPAEEPTPEEPPIVENPGGGTPGDGDLGDLGEILEDL